jgi:putative nucleotidyltransferase with HDIG domain
VGRRVTRARGGRRDPDHRRLQAAYAQLLRYAEDLRGLYQRLQRATCQALLGLANALEAKDPYTRGHAERVGAWSRALGVALGLPPREVEAVGRGGLLHDIGKIGVPEAVLAKPGALDATDWAHIRRHPVVGAQIVAPFEFLREVAPLILHHHERWDGSGYPDGLAGGAIPRGARIIAVADVWDALTSHRPYRGALTAAAALAVLERAAGRTLDADVVTAFSGLVRDRVGA